MGGGGPPPPRESLLVGYVFLRLQSILSRISVKIIQNTNLKFLKWEPDSHSSKREN